MKRYQKPPGWTAIAIVICASLACLVYTGLLLQEGFSWTKFIPAICWAVVLVIWLIRYHYSKREQPASDAE